MTKITKQEMFDRAWSGLSSQGFKQCITGNGTCIYADGFGNHCAWGWIDKASWPFGSDQIRELKQKMVGLAADLDDTDLVFAQHLQCAHDDNVNSHTMEIALRELAARWKLTVLIQKEIVCE